MTSYEISTLILNLREQLDTGLIDVQTFEDTLEGLEAGDKLNGLLYAIKRIDAEAEMLKAEKLRIDKELKKQEKNKDTLKSFVNLIMNASGASKFDGVAGKISYRKSESVEVTPDFVERNLNADYIKKDITYKLDKKALKEAILAHGNISGAEIITKLNLQIK